MTREQTIISTIITSLIVVINPILMHFGIVVDDSTVYFIGSYIAAAICFAWALWKNHNFTDAALAAQDFLKTQKNNYDPEDDEELPQ